MTVEIPTMVESFANDLREKLEQLANEGNEKLVILIAQVDPDAIGAALGLEFICESYNVPSWIYYCGQIDHPQNRMVDKRLAQAGHILLPVPDPISESFHLALVDSSSTNDSRLPDEWQRLTPWLVIDHHSESADRPALALIDQTVGAASTLVTEIIIETIAEGEQMSKLTPIVTTALALGIHSDTKGLLGASERDRTAFDWLRSVGDLELLHELVEFDLPESFFRNAGRAFSDLEKGPDGMLLSSAGRLHPDDGTDLALIADRLVRMTGITTVLVWAIIESKLRISIRNRNPALPLTQKIAEWFGKGCGGAKQTPSGIDEGGALITLDLGWLGNEPLDDDLLIQKIKRQLARRVLGKHA